MVKTIPTSTPQLNRLRAAAGLIPLIEAGQSDNSLSHERVAQMLLFCEWATSAIQPTLPEEKRLAEVITQGIFRLRIESPAEIDAAPYTE